MLIGPIVSGFLVRRVGYYWMNSILGMWEPTTMLLTILTADTW
jgi:hypothetical protein